MNLAQGTLGKAPSAQKKINVNSKQAWLLYRVRNQDHPFCEKGQWQGDTVGFWCIIVITADLKSFENDDVLDIFCTLAQNNKVNLKGKVSTAVRPGEGTPLRGRSSAPLLALCSQSSSADHSKGTCSKCQGLGTSSVVYALQQILQLGSAEP